MGKHHKKKYPSPETYGNKDTITYICDVARKVMEGKMCRENVCSTFTAKFENGHMGVDFNDPIYIVDELSIKIGNMFLINIITLLEQNWGILEEHS